MTDTFVVDTPKKKHNQLIHFTPETARIAAAKSAAARKPLDKAEIANRAYRYQVDMMDDIASQLRDIHKRCDLCKQFVDLKTLDSLSSRLEDLCERVIERAWGKPGTEASSERHGSLEDYKRAAAQVKAAVEVPPEVEAEDQ